MRTLSGIVAIVVGSLAGPALADDAIEGTVVSAEGRFTADGRIVTDAVIRTDDGRELTVVQAGGRAGGFAQVTLPQTHPILGATMKVAVRLRAASDARRRAALVVEDVRVVDPGTAQFVRTGPTPAGNYLYWGGGCVFMTYDTLGTSHLEGELEYDVMDAALEAWNGSTAVCSYLELVPAEPAAVPEDSTGIGKDYVNRVIFRDDTWCRPETDDAPEFCLPRNAAGLTTVTFVDDAGSSRDGEIVDADVELNGADFAISHDGVSAGTAPCQSDLQNTFTHELGHVLGLDHTCLAEGDDPRVDDNGDPVPLCADVGDDPDITQATMYNFQDCGETVKRTPEADDIDAICTVYPKDDFPGTCEPVDPTPGCCSAGGGAGGAAFLTALTSLAWAAGRRRRPAA